MSSHDGIPWNLDSCQFTELVAAVVHTLLRQEMLESARVLESDAEFWAMYAEVRSLGKGCFGAVVLARHIQTGELVAVKIILKASFSAPPAMSPPNGVPYGTIDPAREAKVLASLRHRRTPAPNQDMTDDC